MNLSYKKVASLVTAGVALALVGSSYADPISGTIQITGDVTFNTGSLLTATTATFGVGPDGTVASGTNSYSAPGVAGSAVDFTNFTFAAPGAQNVSPLWTFLNTTNNWTYSFNLAEITNIVRQDVGGTHFLNILGTGTVTITGAGSPFDSTFANWSFNVTDTSGGNNGTFVFAFNDSNTATGRVPDGGATIALLGAALAGLALIRRKFVA